MIKGKATLTFKFYEDPSGMQKYVSRPPEPQEGEDVHGDDNQEELPLNGEEEEEAAEAEPVEEKPANTGGPLVMTAYDKGLCTGSTMVISFECPKDVMRSFLEAEQRGLAPFFSFSIQ